jgi:pimeloyl-ACP methyl ester carboxylesterase
MEAWDRRFVDALAQHYHVVIFDNAGVGQTRALPAPLTIDAMASQTSALITALGLTRPDILGWSMGTMIAQALAVLHPGQVRRLVLCAAYPGNGTAIRPPQANDFVCAAWLSGLRSISGPEMSETGLTVPDMNESLSRYTVTVTVGCDGGYLPNPATFSAAADQAARSRSASIISAHLADKIISVVTVTAPSRYAAMAVARAVVLDALKRQTLSSSQPAASDCA